MATKPRSRGPVGATLLVLVLAAACGGKVDLSIGECSADAVTYCKTNGCPLTGPAASTGAALAVWCAASPAIATRVTGFGSCTVPSGQSWATNVRATDAGGNLLYLLYDPSSAALLTVSTFGPRDGGVDAGTGEQDYGFCDEHTGVVTCTSTAFTCP